MKTSEQVQKDLERLQQRTYRSPVVHLPGQKYVYVFGQTYKGRTAVLGPYSVGDPQIEESLADLFDAEKFELDTRDLNKATKQIKHIMLSRGKDIDKCLDRALHQRGVAREKR